MDDLAEAGETPVPATRHRAKDYFTTDGMGDGTRSAGSGSSGERADNVAELNSADAARLASNSLLQSTVTREKSVRNPDELRRRGSVDERTMTMSAGRLYIANPDADSDWGFHLLGFSGGYTKVWAEDGCFNWAMARQYMHFAALGYRRKIGLAWTGSFDLMNALLVEALVDWVWEAITLLGFSGIAYMEPTRALLELQYLEQ
jgi:hypothetical protein